MRKPEPGIFEHTLDLTDLAAVRDLVAQVAPALVINAAANTHLESCERDPGAALLLASPWGRSRRSPAATRRAASPVVLPIE